MRKHTVAAIIGFVTIVTVQAQGILNTATNANWTSQAPLWVSTPWGVSFTTGNNNTTLLTIALDILTPATSSFQVDVYDNSSLTPGNFLGNLSGSTTANSICTYTTSGINLSANTTYWLVMSDPAGSDIGMVYNPTSTSTDGWTTGPLVFNPGDTWRQFGQGWVPLMEFNAVPEPSTMALAIMGLGGLIICLFKKKAPLNK